MCLQARPLWAQAEEHGGGRPEADCRVRACFASSQRGVFLQPQTCRRASVAADPNGPNSTTCMGPDQLTDSSQCWACGASS